MENNKNKLKEMSEARAEIFKLIERYNVLANEVGSFTRIAVIDGEAYPGDDYSKGMDVNDYVKNNWNARPEGADVEAPGADGWFSSEFCYL